MVLHDEIVYWFLCLHWKINPPHVCDLLKNPRTIFFFLAVMEFILNLYTYNYWYDNFWTYSPSIFYYTYIEEPLIQYYSSDIVFFVNVTSMTITPEYTFTVYTSTIDIFTPRNNISLSFVLTYYRTSVHFLFECLLHEAINRLL